MERIREQRRVLGLTLNQLSEKVGIPTRTLAFMERSSYRNLKNIITLATFFAVPPSYLCEFNDEVPEDRKVVEKVVEVPVVTYKDMERIPNYWKTDENGQLVRWKERRGTV